MPHQCTGCGETFDDGSKEMLSGCPACGGNKFQFHPKGAEIPDDPDPPEPSTDAEAPPERDDSSVTETVGRATTRVRDFVSSGDEPEPDPNAAWPGEAGDEPAAGVEPNDGEIIDADARSDGHEADEDAAQASARSGLASSEEVRDVGGSAGSSAAGAGDSSPPDAGSDADSGTAAAERSDRPPAGGDDRVVSEPSGADPDLSELRDQLNDQFESIKILEPGQYELNLMELYDREEYIIALQENGRYVIQVPDQWIGNDLDER